MSRPNPHNIPKHRHHTPNNRFDNYTSKEMGYSFEHEYSKRDDDRIDLKELFLFFWNKRMAIAKITSTFILIGIAIALFSQIEYQANATLLSETQANQSNASNLLQQYGGLLGIGDAQSPAMEGTIPPQLYPDIVESLPYLIELMNKKVSFVSYDTTVSVHTFLSEIHQPFSLFGFLKEYTVGLPGKIAGLFKSDNFNNRPLITDANRDSVLTLSREQMQTVNALRERLSVNVSQETGVISVMAEFPDSQAAANILHAGISLLKKYMRDYRTQKAQNDLEFVKEQVAKAKERFEEAQNKLVEFRDSNLNLATAKAQTREQELQSQYELAFNLYNTLSQQLQQKRLQVQEQTPVFTVIQPVSVPLEKSAPERLMILVISGLIGVLVSIGWVLTSSWWKEEPLQFAG